MPPRMTMIKNCVGSAEIEIAGTDELIVPGEEYARDAGDAPGIDIAR